MYECFNCGCRTVIWGADFTFEDYGIDGEGIIHTLTCINCGAEIEYYISLDDEEGEVNENNNAEVSATQESSV